MASLPTPVSDVGAGTAATTAATPSDSADHAAAWAAYYAANPQWAAYYAQQYSQQGHYAAAAGTATDPAAAAATQPAADAATAPGEAETAAADSAAPAEETQAAPANGDAPAPANGNAAEPAAPAPVAPAPPAAGYGAYPYSGYGQYPGQPVMAPPPAQPVPQPVMAPPPAMPYGLNPPPMMVPPPQLAPPPQLSQPIAPGAPGYNPAHPNMRMPTPGGDSYVPGEKIGPQPGQEEFFRRTDNWPGRGYLVRYVGEAIHRAQETPLNIRHDCLIERRVIGRLLGKGGRDLEAMQLCSGAEIFIIDKYPPPGEGDDHRLLVLIGKPDQVRLAKSKVDVVLARAREELPPLPPPLTSGWRPVPTVGQTDEEGGQGWVSMPMPSGGASHPEHKRPRDDDDDPRDAMPGPAKRPSSDYRDEPLRPPPPPGGGGYGLAPPPPPMGAPDMQYRDSGRRDAYPGSMTEYGRDSYRR